MKAILHFTFLLVFFTTLPLTGLGHARDASGVLLQETATVAPQPATSEPPTVTATDTPLASPTPAPPPSATPSGGRPQLVVAEYHPSQETVHAGSDFDLEISFRNDGPQSAQGVNVVFAGDNFYIRETGGVWSRPGLAPGESFTIRQPLTATWSLAGYTMGTTTLTANYTDASGTTYTDTFSISVDIFFDPNWGKPTRTPVLGENPEIVVQGYHVDVAELKPGTTFSLELDLANLGSQLAKGVRMLVGGNSELSAGPSAASPFAALDSSNLIHVGNLSPGETRLLTQRLIVDLKASAGVYTLPLSFEYSNDKGLSYANHQEITLKIYTTPQLKISFYENPTDLQVGVTGTLPIQVVNMGYQTVLLGDLRLAASQATLTGDNAFIGPLESGGSFTHDAEILPGESGQLVIHVTVEYNDVDNHPQKVTQTLTVQVADVEKSSATEESRVLPLETVANAPQGGNFWQQFIHFFRSLLGLGG